jgi:hypothetical protein
MLSLAVLSFFMEAFTEESLSRLSFNNSTEGIAFLKGWRNGAASSCA